MVMNSELMEMNPVMPITEYLEAKDLVAKEIYPVYGMVEHGSVKYDVKHDVWKFL